MKTLIKNLIILIGGMTLLFSVTPETTADNDVKDPNLLIVYSSDVQGYLEECG